ncbi:roadblock/LC7 domain-containing protein [Dactylosporangium sp. NBC_01737]|uniref:roadblock/LC7 domain-containing protein n=1 Tax=Dactylosporangium sp. NBC_01737 TaxID=2975959 RepID=UPI002E0EC99E|nr:roadblock/LC7 domain-containing protein [Dactylosporangium sp. NBC_01737]
MEQKHSVAELQWLLNDLVKRVGHLQQAVVLSADGLLLAASDGLSKDDADHFAAIASGLQSIARGAGRRFGTGAVRQTIVEMESGFMLVTAAGHGAFLAVLTGSDADIGLITYEMAMLVVRVGKYLATATRTPADPADVT